MNKIEEIIKKSLENAEAPYDAKAWDSMASRLDQVMPTSQPKGSFKWAWIASAVFIAGSATLFFVNQNAETTDKVELAQNKTEKIEKEADKSVEILKSIEPLNQDSSIKTEAVKTDERIVTNEKSIKNVIKRESVRSNNTSAGIVTDNKLQNHAVAPSVDKANEIVQPTKVMKAVSLDKEFVSKEIVAGKIDFNVSNETLYEKGLPFNSLTCNITAKSYKWTNEKGELLSTDKNADVHLYTIGSHPITLTIETLEGEVESVTKSVRCEVNYNLLAVTGFNPTSSDYRNNTFIPFALLKSERNIPFEMQIIDPKTGQVIFETKNADLPWDGMDMRTNQMVPINSTYIWRVSIYEKAIGEPTNRYQGTITRI